jgi:hypothetical protein
MPFDIATGIAAARATIEVSTKISSLLARPKINEDEVRNGLKEMLIHIVNAQSALASARLEITELRQKVSELSASKALAASIVFVENVYWLKMSDGMLDGPFCPMCRHSLSERLTRMRFRTEDYYNIPGGGTATRKRKFDCLMHGDAREAEEYLIPSTLFEHVKIQWTPPVP